MTTLTADTHHEGPLVFERTQFVENTYFDFRIIQNAKDGYVNATKMCEEISSKSGKQRRLRNYIRHNEWSSLCDLIRKQQSVTPFYDLTINTPNAFKGIYIHPDLVHFVAHWASLEYSVTVAKVMKAIHERNQLVGRDTTNEVIAKLQEENEVLKQKLIDSGVKIAELNMRAVPEEHKDAYMVLINETDVDGKYRVTKRVMHSLNAKPVRELEQTAIIKRFHLPIGLSFAKDMAKALGLTYKKNHFIDVAEEKLKQIRQYLENIPRTNHSPDEDEAIKIIADVDRGNKK